jgi:hypothetical protein
MANPLMLIIYNIAIRVCSLLSIAMTRKSPSACHRCLDQYGCDVCGGLTLVHTRSLLKNTCTAQVSGYIRSPLNAFCSKKGMRGVYRSGWPPGTFQGPMTLAWKGTTLTCLGELECQHICIVSIPASFV